MPPVIELRCIEPPWELFVQMATETFGISEAEAREITDRAKREWGGVQ